MFGNGQYVIPAKAGIHISVWTLRRWQIMPGEKIYYDQYKLAFNHKIYVPVTSQLEL